MTEQRDSKRRSCSCHLSRHYGSRASHNTTLRRCCVLASCNSNSLGKGGILIEKCFCSERLFLTLRLLVQFRNSHEHEVARDGTAQDDLSLASTCPIRGLVRRELTSPHTDSVFENVLTSSCCSFRVGNCFTHLEKKMLTNFKTNERITDRTPKSKV